VSQTPNPRCLARTSRAASTFRRIVPREVESRDVVYEPHLLERGDVRDSVARVTAALLMFASLGWAASVIGATLAVTKGSRISYDTDGTPLAAGSDRWSRIALMTTVLGASCGGAGTILAVLAS
jgi:hypothetical protein